MRGGAGWRLRTHFDDFPRAYPLPTCGEGWGGEGGQRGEGGRRGEGFCIPPPPGLPHRWGRGKRRGGAGWGLRTHFDDSPRVHPLPTCGEGWGGEAAPNFQASFPGVGWSMWPAKFLSLPKNNKYPYLLQQNNILIGKGFWRKFYSAWLFAHRMAWYFPTCRPISLKLPCPGDHNCPVHYRTALQSFQKIL